MYSPANYGNTVRILAAMAEYINHIEDKFSLDNVMALELLNEPWAHLVSGRAINTQYGLGWKSCRIEMCVHEHVARCLLSAKLGDICGSQLLFVYISQMKKLSSTDIAHLRLALEG